MDTYVVLYRNEQSKKWDLDDRATFSTKREASAYRKELIAILNSNSVGHCFSAKVVTYDRWLYINAKQMKKSKQ